MNAYFKNLYTASMTITALLLLSPVFGFSWDNAPQNEITWSDNLRQALELSRQQDKLVLLHFYSDTCPPCKMMEKSTFPNPAVVKEVHKNFIPVKLNVKRYPREAKMFNVTCVPMDIVLMPDGQQIQAATGGQDAHRYSQFLTTAQAASKSFIVKSTPEGGQVGTVTISGHAVNHNLQSPNQPIDSSPFVSEAEQNDKELPPLPEFPPSPTPDHSYAVTPSASVPSNIEAGGACPINETPSFDYSSIPAEDREKIEFEGYCPVELIQHGLWIRGDYKNRLEFEGRLYLFVGKAQMEEFYNNSEKYAPAYQGIDIVVWRERGEKVHGIRNYGAWAVGRVFLFSSEENLIKFEKNARYYLTPNKN